MESTIQICIECGHVGNVQNDCSSWACADCGKIQTASQDRVQLAALCDARHIIRESQKTLHSADDWHFLADSLNYLDAQIDTISDYLAVSNG